MKKVLCLLLPLVATIFFCGCEVSNAELANSLEGNMTRLVYQIGYLDSIPSAELETLVASNNYFSGYANYRNSFDVGGVSTTQNGNYADFSSSFRSSVLTPAGNPNTGSQSVLNSGLNSTSVDAVNPQTATSIDRSATTPTLINNDSNVSPIAETDVNLNTNTSSNNVSFVDISLIENSQQDLNDILLQISKKRGIIMLYCTDLRGGNLKLLPQDKLAVSEYITILKETTNYLSSSAGLLTAHYNNVVEIANAENNQELINAKLIRASEVLKTRYAKLDTCIDSMDAIISILRNYVGYDYALSEQSAMSNINTTGNHAEDLSDSSLVLDNTSSSINTNNTLDDTNANTNTNNISENPVLDYETDCHCNCKPCICKNESLPQNQEVMNNTLPNSSQILPESTDAIPQSSQNNTIINNNYSGSTPTNNNVAGGNISKQQPIPVETTESINQSPANLDGNGQFADTMTSKVQDPITTATTTNDEVEIILNGGLTRNQNPVVENEMNTGFQKINGTTSPQSRTNNLQYDEPYTGIETTFNNPASSPNPINSGNLVSNIALTTVHTEHTESESNTSSRPLTQKEAQTMIEKIENPVEMVFPEPVDPAPLNPKNELLPEVIQGSQPQTPESFLPLNENSPQYIEQNNVRNYAELGSISLIKSGLLSTQISPDSYREIDLMPLPFTK